MTIQPVCGIHDVCSLWICTSFDYCTTWHHDFGFKCHSCTCLIGWTIQETRLSWDHICDIGSSQCGIQLKKSWIQGTKGLFLLWSIFSDGSVTYTIFVSCHLNWLLLLLCKHALSFSTLYPSWQSVFWRSYLQCMVQEISWLILVLLLFMVSGDDGLTWTRYSLSFDIGAYTVVATKGLSSLLSMTLYRLFT